MKAKMNIGGAVFATGLFCLVATVQAANSDIGIVILHGKDAAPGASTVTVLRDQFLSEGFLVATPEMPWSHNRIYEVGYLGAMNQINTAISNLKASGATKIFVGGHSMGGNGAVGYAARIDDFGRTADIAGIFVLALGHRPELTYDAYSDVAASVEQARTLVQAGQGTTVGTFKDVNTTTAGPFVFDVTAQAGVYLSYMNPTGPAVVPTNMGSIATPLPVFWAVGQHDPIATPSSYAYDLAPYDPLSQFVSYDAGHMGVSAAAALDLKNWIYAVAVPEPENWALLISGLGLVGFAARRRRS